jgi:hypothetical protein
VFHDCRSGNCFLSLANQECNPDLILNFAISADYVQFIPFLLIPVFSSTNQNKITLPKRWLLTLFVTQVGEFTFVNAVFLSRHSWLRIFNFVNIIYMNLDTSECRRRNESRCILIVLEAGPHWLWESKNCPRAQPSTYHSKCIHYFAGKHSPRRSRSRLPRWLRPHSSGNLSDPTTMSEGQESRAERIARYKEQRRRELAAQFNTHSDPPASHRRNSKDTNSSGSEGPRPTRTSRLRAAATTAQENCSSPPAAKLNSTEVKRPSSFWFFSFRLKVGIGPMA